MRWVRNCREQLRGAFVRTSEHAHLAVRVRPGTSPRNGVIPIRGLVLEWIPLTHRCKPAAHILQNRDITASRESHAHVSFALLVIGRAQKKHWKLARCLRTIDIGAEQNTVAHSNFHIALKGNFVAFCREPDRGKDDKKAAKQNSISNRSHRIL